MNNTTFLFLFLTCLYLTACQDSSTAYNEATTTEASTVIYKRVNNTAFKKFIADIPNAQLVDVRTAGEYADGRIGNAQNIDYKSTDFKAKIGALDKSKPVLVYCQAGGRSQKACGIMQGLGFTEIYELENGYGNWE